MRDPRDATNPCEIGRLKRRADFLRVAAGKRWHARGMSVQVASAEQGEDEIRLGFTLTRKVGGAVVRNRIRRRLREAVRLACDLPVRRGHDYVILGRIEALRLPFETLRRELDGAIRAAHDAGRSARPRSKDKRVTDKRPTRTTPAP